MADIQRARMPAEWEPHRGTLMEWPVSAALVYPENYARVCADYGKIAGAIREFEPVLMIVNPEELPVARAYCGSRVEYLVLPHNDAWCRDNGPTFVSAPDGALEAIDWQFNAWGGKYVPWDADNAVAGRVAQLLGVPAAGSSLVLEGGSVHVDGEGTLLTTRQCLRNPNRNPDWSEREIEAELSRRLGVSRFIWLERGLDGDETDGHVDNVACFTEPGTVVMQTCDDQSDPNCAVARENLAILRGSRDAAGRVPQVAGIPQPPARYYEGKRLTLSYLNFYLVNGGVILPVFGGQAAAADRRAAGILRELFPGRRVVTVDSTWLVAEGGNVHCVTQQIPLERVKREDAR